MILYEVASDWTWENGFKPTAYNDWESYGDESCVTVGFDSDGGVNGITISSRNNYIEKGFDILSFGEFFRKCKVSEKVDGLLESLIDE